MSQVIVGYGVVGKNMHKIFPDAAIHDPAKGLDATGHYDVAFVCVPTEACEDGSLDMTIVEDAVDQWLDKVDAVCVKSTVMPGFVEGFIGKPVVHSPEFFGGTPSANAINYDFVILGGGRHHCDVVAEQYKLVKSGYFKIIYTDSRTAELAKLMENSWIATKVTFCNEWAKIADAAIVNYTELRELWLLDSRVSPSHTWVFRDGPGWSSHCLEKDVPAAIASSTSFGYTPHFMLSVVESNKKHKS